MAAWKIAPALAAGCTIVIHPSSSTSLSLLSLAQKINHLLPKGVLNIITGRGSKSGEYMLHHKGFNKLAFTGSTEIGRRIGIAAAEMLIPSTLELGGKSANIFFDDMPFDKALEGAQKAFCSTKAKCAALARASSYKKAFTTNSSTPWQKSSKNQSRTALGRRYPNGFASQRRPA